MRGGIDFDIEVALASVRRVASRRQTRYSPRMPVDIQQPLVVYDWGAIRGLARGDSLPTNVSPLLADTVFNEIANSKDPGGFAFKLSSVLSTPQVAARVCVGRYWGELSQMQTTPSTVLRAEDVVHAEMTAGLRQLLAQDSSDWPERIAYAADGTENQEHQELRRQFVSLCESWTAYISGKQGVELSRIRGDVRAQHEWVRQPELVTEFVVSRNPRYDRDDWRTILTQFPDELAIGRWARVIVWYALMRSLNPQGDQHAFENDWDDAHYAFLASYAERIVTNDKGLRRAIWAVFPSVEVASRPAS